MKTINSIVLGAAFAATVATVVTASTVALTPIEKSFNYNGQETTVTIHPEFALGAEDGEIRVEVDARIDASNVKTRLAKELNKAWKYEECGERLNTKNFSISAVPDGGAALKLTAQAQLWECASMHVPEFYMKRVKIGFAKFDVPATRMVLKKMKTKLISQSISIAANVYPEVVDGVFTAKVDVTHAMPSGLAKKLVKAFGLHGKIKGLVESKVREAIKAQPLNLPPEIQEYDVQVQHVDFVNLANGGIALDVSASGQVDQEQIADILNEKLSKLN